MTTEDMEKYRVIESRKISKGSLRFLRHIGEMSDWNDVRDWVSTNVMPNMHDGREYVEFQALLHKIDIEESEGHRPSQVQDLRQMLNDMREAKAFKEATFDDLSRVGFAVPPYDESDFWSWSDLSIDCYLRVFGEPGGFMTIHGLPQKGKTTIGCLYGEMWHEKHPDCEILTNIPLHHKVGLDWVRQVSTMSELLRGVADALKQKRKWLWIFDEAAPTYLRTDALRGDVRGLDKWIRDIPKFKGSLIVIEHRAEGITATLSEFTVSHIWAETPGMAYLDIPNHHMMVKNIPKPESFIHRPDQPNILSINIDIEDFMAALGPETSQCTLSDMINEYLDKDARMKARPRDEITGRLLPKSPIPSPS